MVLWTTKIKVTFVGLLRSTGFITQSRNNLYQREGDRERRHGTDKKLRNGKILSLDNFSNAV